MSEECYESELEPLSYSYDTLESYISTQTMQIHHDRPLKGHVDKLNVTLKDCPQLQKVNLDCMLRNLFLIPQKIRTSVIHSGGGVSNHNLFFKSLRPSGKAKNVPVGKLKNVIETQFGSYEKLGELSEKKTMTVFGSGWMWLVEDRNGGLIIFQTVNQDSPLSSGFYPLMVIGVWEYAYFLQYLNLRDQHIDNWFHVIDWDRANQLYEIHD